MFELWSESKTKPGGRKRIAQGFIPGGQGQETTESRQGRKNPSSVSPGLYHSPSPRYRYLYPKPDPLWHPYGIFRPGPDSPARGGPRPGFRPATIQGNVRGSVPRAVLRPVPRGRRFFHRAELRGDVSASGRAEKACRLLYPAYGTYVGGNIGQFFEASIYWPVYLGSVGVGHIVGLTTVAGLHEEPAPEPAPEPAEAGQGDMQ